MLALVAFASCQRASDPSVILISVDTLRADHMSLYGYGRATTPQLDRFFGRGTVFENAVSPSSCTLPSIPQLLAGSHTVSASQPTLAEILRDRGYETAAIVSQQQFDPQWHARADRSKLAAEVRRGFTSFDLQGAEELDAHRMSMRNATGVTDRALAWLAANGDHERFFLWLHYLDPHDPYEPPASFRGFDRGNPSPRSGDRRQYLQAERQSPNEPWYRAGYVFDATDVAHFVNLYDGEILYADAEIGRVLDALDARGLTARTIVAFVSDHGENLGENDRWDHCQTLGEREIHVPLMVRDRGRPLAARARVASPVSTLDLAPTILSLLGMTPTPQAGAVVLGARDPARPVFAAWRGATAVRAGTFKLVSDADGLALFDLAADPREQTNVLGAHPEVKRELVVALEAFGRASPLVESQNRNILEQLRALGYIE